MNISVDQVVKPRTHLSEINRIITVYFKDVGVYQSKKELSVCLSACLI